MSMGPKRTGWALGSVPGHEEVTGHRIDFVVAVDKDGTSVSMCTSVSVVGSCV